MAVSRQRLFLLLLVGRLGLAVWTRTYFQPDEFWQSLEVAHRIVFGYGYATWEWRDGRSAAAASAALSTWDALVKGSPVRSIAYPALFVPLFWLLKVLRIDSAESLDVAPRVLQAVFDAIGDMFAVGLAARVGSFDTGYWVLHVWYSIPYQMHTAGRTFSNTLEATLTAAALYYWPVSAVRNSRTPVHIARSLPFMALAFIVRPTSALLWAFLGADLGWRHPRWAAWILWQGAVAVAIALGVQIALDSAFYGRTTVTALSFLQANVLGASPVSLFYGESAAHYYFTQALPVLFLAETPYVLIGWALSLAPRPERFFADVQNPELLTVLARAALWVTLCLSALGHKEWRFLQPLIPMFNIFVALVIVQHIQDRAGPEEEAHKVEGKEAAEMPANTTSIAGDTEEVRPYRVRLPPRVLALLDKIHWLVEVSIVLNLVLTAYLKLGHGLGQRRVVAALHAEGRAIASVGYLMPCHSTPWQSGMHLPHLERAGPSGDGGLAWFLTCEPPLNGEDLKTYRHQTRVFYEDPYAYLTTRFPARVDRAFPPSPYPPAHANADGSRNWTHTWPSHLVLFETLLAHGSKSGETVGELLRGHGYVEAKRLWNGFGSDDENRWGDVLVLAWRDASRASD